MFFDNLSLIVQQELQIYNVQFCFKKEKKKISIKKKWITGGDQIKKKKKRPSKRERKKKEFKKEFPNELRFSYLIN